MSELTKREEIAAMAMQGLLACRELTVTDEQFNTYAKIALKHADELIELLKPKASDSTLGYFRPMHDDKDYCVVCQNTGKDSTGLYSCSRCSPSFSR